MRACLLKSLMAPLAVLGERMLVHACLQPLGFRPVALLVLLALPLGSVQAAPVRDPLGPTPHGVLLHQPLSFRSCSISKSALHHLSAL